MYLRNEDEWQKMAYCQSLSWGVALCGGEDSAHQLYFGVDSIVDESPGVSLWWVCLVTLLYTVPAMSVRRRGAGEEVHR